MLKLIPRRWSNQANPIATRWNYFARTLDSIPATIDLIQAVPEDKFRDVAFLEEKLIPSLGLNDENLEEQPKELAPFFGNGLHIFQYPNQLARYMAWLAEYATDTRSYVEIGTRWGGTLIVICEWLRRIGTPLSSVTAIDPIGETQCLKPMAIIYPNTPSSIAFSQTPLPAQQLPIASSTSALTLSSLMGTTA